MLTPTLRAVALAALAALALPAAVLAVSLDPPSSARPTEDQAFPGLAHQARSAASTVRPTEDQAFPGLAREARAAVGAAQPETTLAAKGFDWGAATIGAGITLGLVLIALATWLAVIRARPRASQSAR